MKLSWWFVIKLPFICQIYFIEAVHYRKVIHLILEFL